jgi:hypothetical protein
VEQNLFFLKVNRLSTKKRDLKTNPRDARIAEKQRNSREEAAMAAAVSIPLEGLQETTVTGGKNGRGA